MKSVLALEHVLHHLFFSLLPFHKFLLESNVPDFLSVQFNGLKPLNISATISKVIRHLTHHFLNTIRKDICEHPENSTS